MNLRKIEFSLLRKPVFILIAVVVFLMRYTQVDYQSCYSDAQSLNSSLSFNDFMVDILMGKFLFALITVVILFEALRRFSTRYKLDRIRFSVKGVLGYQFRMVVLVSVTLLIYLSIVIPIQEMTSNVELRIDQDPILMAEVLASHFSFVLLLGMAFGNINMVHNLLYQPNRQLGQRSTIEAYDAIGKVEIEIEEITYIERVDRKYYAHTSEKQFEMKKNISELEKELQPYGFFKANRSVLINKQFIDSIRFWQFDKYILTLKAQEGVEINLSRSRRNELKRQNGFENGGPKGL